MAINATTRTWPRTAHGRLGRAGRGPRVHGLRPGHRSAVHDSLLNAAGMSDVPDGKNPAVVYALDGVTVYVKNPQGAMASDTATGSTSCSTPAPTVRHRRRQGRPLRLPPGGRRRWRLRGRPDLWDPLAGTLNFLSPGGRYVMGGLARGLGGVFDTATAEQLPRPSAAGCQYFGGYMARRLHLAAIGYGRPGTAPRGRPDLRHPGACG